MPAAPATHSGLQSSRDIGVAWMNRGHALILRNDSISLASALDAYNEAIVVLRRLPVSENPSWANSLGAALMNRGYLVHRLHGVAQATVALETFAEAEKLLRPLALAGMPWPRRNLGGTLLNRASLLLDLSQPDLAAAIAREILDLIGPHEQADMVDADLSLKARRALCDAIGHLIVATGADQETLADEASDLVDEGLALARHWTKRGAPEPRELTLRLFCYGTQLYRLHQPHFLAEFIRENLRPSDAELRAIAVAAINEALADRPAEFLTIGDPSSERRLEAWRELAVLRTQLAA